MLVSFETFDMLMCKNVLLLIGVVSVVLVEELVAARD